MLPQTVTAHFSYLSYNADLRRRGSIWAISIQANWGQIKTPKILNMWESINLIQYFDIFTSFWCQIHHLILYLYWSKMKKILIDSVFGHFIILKFSNFFILKSCSSKRVKVLKDNNWTIVWIFFIILWFLSLKLWHLPPTFHYPPTKIFPTTLIRISIFGLFLVIFSVSNWEDFKIDLLW